MCFSQAIRNSFKNYVNFRGRASRPEFWWFFSFIVLVYVALFVISNVGVATSPDSQAWNTLANVGIIGTITWFLVTIIPVSAIWFRRLHDSNKSGWWYVLTSASGLIGLILIVLSALQNQILFASGMAAGLASSIGSIVLLVFAILPSTTGPNRYAANHQQ